MYEIVLKKGMEGVRGNDGGGNSVKMYSNTYVTVTVYTPCTAII
jgi:hypothetical protein